MGTRPGQPAIKGMLNTYSSPPAQGLGVGSSQSGIHLRNTLVDAPPSRVNSEVSSQPEERPDGSNRILRRVGKVVGPAVMPPIRMPVANVQQSGNVRVAVQEFGIKVARGEGKVQFVGTRKGAGSESEPQGEGLRISRSSGGKTASVGSAGTRSVTAAATGNPRSATAPWASTQDLVPFQTTRQARNHVLTDIPRDNHGGEMSKEISKGQDRRGRTRRELPSSSVGRSSTHRSAPAEVTGSTRESPLHHSRSALGIPRIARGSSPASSLREGMVTVNPRSEVKNSIGELRVGKVAYEDEPFSEALRKTPLEPERTTAVRGGTGERGSPEVRVRPEPANRRTGGQSDRLAMITLALPFAPAARVPRHLTAEDRKWKIFPVNILPNSFSRVGKTVAAQWK